MDRMIPPFEKRMVLLKNTLDWTYSFYKIKELNDLGYQGKGITVAVIDTGINLGHNEFQNAEVHACSTRPDRAILDGQGHGTWCCSRIVGQRFGYSPDAKLVSIKALDDYGSGNMHDVLDALHMAIDMEVDIISASLGWPCGLYKAELEKIGRRAKQKNILIFAAAGNDGKYNDVDSPACEDGFIGVAAFTSRFGRSIFSDYGEHAMIYAPGDGKGAYLGQEVAHLSGTSMATPTAAAVTAMILPTLRDRGDCLTYETIQNYTTCE